MGLSCSTSVTSPLKCTSIKHVESAVLEKEIESKSTDVDLIKLSEGDCADYDKFLSRIATFFNDETVNHNWLSKPPTLSPPSCAIFGWRLTSCNMLTCELCGSKLFAEVSAKLPPHIARKCLKEIERNLRSGHTKGCAYRFAPCPDNFKFVSAKATSALIDDFQRRLDSLKVLSNDLPCVTLDEYEQLDKIKADSDLKDIPTELVILALLGWEHHSTAYNRFVFIKCGYCFRKVCTMFYKKLTREEELLIEEAEQKKKSESGSSDEQNSETSGSFERKRRGSKDILELRNSTKRKRKPQDQLNPYFEHRSWCAWISKEERASPIGWKILLDLLVVHHSRLQDERVKKDVSHDEVIEKAEKMLDTIRRKSDHWKTKIDETSLITDTISSDTS